MSVHQTDDMWSSVIRKSQPANAKPAEVKDVFASPTDWQPPKPQPRIARPLDIFGSFSLSALFASTPRTTETVVQHRPKAKDIFS